MSISSRGEAGKAHVGRRRPPSNNPLLRLHLVSRPDMSVSVINEIVNGCSPRDDHCSSSVIRLRHENCADQTLGAPESSALTNSGSDESLSTQGGHHGLPSPPGAPLQLNAQTPPHPLAPLDPLTPPSINDASDQGLTNAFYTYFHPTHPFLPPQHCLGLLEDWHTSNLKLAIRFVGSLYVRSAKQHEYQKAFRHLIAQNALPMDGTRVQALLLFAIGLHMSDLEQESAEVMRDVAQLACELGMNRNEYAIHYGNGNPVLEECWRRTWWEVFVCDGFFAGVNPQHYALVLQGIKQDVFLPCEEVQFLAGVGDPLLTYMIDTHSALASATCPQDFGRL